MKREKPSPAEYTPEDIYRALDRFVVGQTKAKRTLAIAAYSHIKRISNPAVRKSGIVKKSNVLMIGPTGCGKTYLAKNLAKILELPFASVDATEYTQAGYYGKDVEVMVGELLHRCGGDPELAGMGIVFIDEIDKIARRSDPARTGANGRDIGGEGVQQSLLRMLEGEKMYIPLNVTQHWNRHDFVEVDTTDIMFICAGTFSDLRIEKIPNRSGFGSRLDGGKSKRIETGDLTRHGMIPELLGRLPVIVELDELSDEELLAVLTVPPDALTKQYAEIFAADGAKLEFEDGALEDVVRLSIRRKVGARGLKGLMEEIMHDHLFELPSFRGKTVKVTRKDVGKCEVA